MIVERLPANRRGRDYVIGDIHAAVSAVCRRLRACGFDPERDRLICVGDLVDRGPEPELVPDLLAEPWFHAVRGNHDVSVLHAVGEEGSPEGLPYRCEDHDWLGGLTATQARALVDALARMPWALEVETPEGRVGIVHAEVPPAFPDWGAFAAALSAPDTGERVRYQAIWSREAAGHCRGRAAGGEPPGPLPDVCRVFHGHTLMPGLAPCRIANRYWIETGGWLPEAGARHMGDSPRFSIVDIRAPGIG